MGNLYYIKLKQPQKAKEAYTSAIRVDALHSYAHYMLGRIYYQESNYDSAMVEIEEAIRFNSDIEDQACLALGDLCAYRKDERAMKYYLAAIDLIYNDVKRFWTLTKLLEENGYYEEAISACRHVLELDPSHNEALLRLAETQLKVRAYRGALDSYSKLAEIDSENAYYHTVMAKIHEQIEDTDGVLICLYNVVDINPDNTDAIAKAAEICLSQNDLEEAKRDIDKGLAVDSKDPRLRVLKGEYLRAIGKDELAIIELKKVISDPEWGNYAQRLIWEIKPPLTEEEKRKREFFERGREKKNR
jgi:tetratricopeptide (TPR) repeat protein